MSTIDTNNPAIVEALKALWAGDLSYRMPAGESPESAAIAAQHNRFLERLYQFARETSRITDEVIEGKFGGQAEVDDLDGVWKDLIDRVNLMGSTLTNQIRCVAETTWHVSLGRFTKKIDMQCGHEMQELKEMINTMVDQLDLFASEVTRVVREVGTEGILGPQVEMPGAHGAWKDLIDDVNRMAGNLTDQLRNIGAVAGALATGDSSQRVTVDAKGETLALKESLNRLADRLSTNFSTGAVS